MDGSAGFWWIGAGRGVLEAKLKLDTNLFRSDRTLAAYLATAVRAARDARLIHIIPGSDDEARSVIEPIVRDHTAALKSAWLRQRRGGIKGWVVFLAKLGYRERLAVEPISPATRTGGIGVGRSVQPADDEASQVVAHY